MFDDPKKELEQLQEKLLQDEEWFERELDSAKLMIGQMPGKRSEARTYPSADAAVMKTVPVRSRAAGGVQKELVFQTPETQEQEEAPMPGKGVKGLVTLVVLELLGILGVAAYWMLFVFG